MKMMFQKLIREIQFLPPLRRFFFPRYQSMMTPAQLCFLCQCIEQTREVPGQIVEIGCALGTTTIFLNKYMDAQHIDKHYICVDTFSGFVAEDIDYEVVNRGKRADLLSAFRVNKKTWFDGTMEMNGIIRVQSIEADINHFDFSILGNIAFCLLDVDLYRPIEHALPRLLDALSPGGIIVVDDCNPQHTLWDGADQAYKEFIKRVSMPSRVMFDKLGIVEKAKN
jgi:predicted O-methyltransferase YrrM